MAKAQTFNDGIVNIYSVKNIADSGNKPKFEPTEKNNNLRFEERTVGINRYWTAKQNQAQIAKLIRVQRINAVNVHDVAVLDGVQYDISQLQYINDVEPSCMDLSLERLEVSYEID